MVGNLSNFTKIDILRCLLKIEKPVSRSELSKILDLGEGTIRAILDILKKHKLLESNKQGHYLSADGNAIVKKIRNNINIEKVESIDVLPNKKKIAVHIKNPNSVGKSYMLRDEAVKNGADGALILNYGKKLELCDSNYKQDFTKIESKFDLSKNDLVIVTYADSYKLAEHGALAAAINVDNNLKNVMHRLK
ncbi:MAG: DUF4443 domain-containing protein [Candidatus Woesearchaeota archaeon]